MGSNGRFRGEFLPHVSLLRKNHIPLMGKNPLSLESTPVFARSRSHSPHARAHNVPAAPAPAAPARIIPIRRRTQALVRPGAHSPALGSPTGGCAPWAVTALASPSGTNAPPVHPLCRACAPSGFVLEGFGMGELQHRGEPPLDASRTRTSALAGRFTRGDATQDARSASAAWSLMVGSVLGATGAVALIHGTDRATGELHLGAFSRRKSPHKVAFTSGSGFAPARPWPSSGLICAFLEEV
ncbi:hypothetical protein AXYL_06854 (plasmid) [Achromobacter xylosoxidans A8]|uniref:Uncharacterized protein n=1 Tax=Achromobacter xylosoxidans (strain A8) TaxID=762376 RepID=E3HYI2_ACHXA|nr:hypothetical protein AXYL_06854 [Achromobacter xylosoxidans A8]